MDTRQFQRLAAALWKARGPHWVREWSQAALSFVYPEVCQLCGLEPAAPREGYVCGACRRQTRWIKPPFCRRCGLPCAGEVTNAFECSNCREQAFHFCWARAAVETHFPVLEVIHRYKYSRHLWFEPFLADLLLRAATPVLREEPWDTLVPVPLHPLKQREREFNQAERLGRHLAAATGLPLETGLLKRTRATKTQTHLAREARAANVRGAFVLRRPTSLRGRRLVLLDDVLTTGATTNACAEVLLRAGADRVCVWTVARGIRRVAVAQKTEPG